MADRASIAANRVYELINSKPGIQLMEAIGELAEALENKPDPERTELFLYESVNSLHEKLGTAKFNLKSYVNESRTMMGDKLSSLYEDADKIRVEK